MTWSVFSSFCIDPLVKDDGKLNSLSEMQLDKEHVLTYFSAMFLFSDNSCDDASTKLYKSLSFLSATLVAWRG